MQVNKKRLTILKNNKTPCEFRWLDITSKHREEVDKLNSISPTSLLTPFKLYGIVFAFDDYTLIIGNDVQEESSDDEEIDYTAMLHANITDINELKGGK